MFCEKIRISELLKQDHTRFWRLKANFMVIKKNNDNKDKTNYSIIIL